jgi:hypothetical protein
MTLRFFLALCAIGIVPMACSSKTNERASASPTAPTGAMALTSGGGVSSPTVVAYPPRADTLDFRRQLESKYSSMGRTASQVNVDQEGEATWIEEYSRYRTNGCDHNTATQRVMEQIDGAAPGALCSLLQFPETAVYPPRDHLTDFRRQLGSKYQSMGRSAQSVVDPDGAAIWVGDYLRYRASGCDHPSSVQKTLTQVDNNPAPDTCVTACAYAFSPGTETIPSSGGTFSTEARRSSGSCEWIATGSDVPWLTANRPLNGTNGSRLSYSVDANTSTAWRRGSIRVDYPGGRTSFVVDQHPAGDDLAFHFYDPAVSATGPTTECLIRTTGTVCTLAAMDGPRPAPVGSYNWLVEYAYNGAKTKTQDGSLSSFSFSETCSNTLAGTVIPISVRLIATGAAGSVTLYSASGSQPALNLRISACPS